MVTKNRDGEDVTTKINKRKSMGRGACRVASDQDGHTHTGGRTEACWSNWTWLKRSCSSGFGPHRWGKLYSGVRGYLYNPGRRETSESHSMSRPPRCYFDAGVVTRSRWAAELLWVSTKGGQSGASGRTGDVHADISWHKAGWDPHHALITQISRTREKEDKCFHSLVLMTPSATFTVPKIIQSSSSPAR